jgi:hypothetical protein
MMYILEVSIIEDVNGLELILAYTVAGALLLPVDGSVVFYLTLSRSSSSSAI